MKLLGARFVRIARSPKKTFFRLAGFPVHKWRALNLRLHVHHVHGISAIDYAEDELVVICVVRNGSIYLNSFVRHYLALGVKHIVFLDNGSTDNTIELASRYDSVTVLKTDLPYSKYENLMKDYLARRFSKNRWNLCADIDEFFDWPFSKDVKLASLLRYLNGKGYTAVVAQMLDLFSAMPLSQLSDSPDDDIAERYQYYDVSDILKSPYDKWSWLSNEAVKMHHGGIRKTVFGTYNGLTKVPLVFVGPKIQLFKGWHHTANAYLAGFTCVLLHYPFTSQFYDKVKEAAATRRYGFFTSDEYEMYWKRLSAEPELCLRLNSARRYASVDRLLDEDFLVASPDYVNWARAFAKPGKLTSSVVSDARASNTVEGRQG